MRRHSQTPQMWSIRQNVSTGQEGNAAEIRIEYDCFLLKITIREVKEVYLACIMVTDNVKKSKKIFTCIEEEGGIVAHSGGENYFLSFHPDKDDIDVDNAGAQ